jgi:CheY-like chemotaxis protein
MANDILKTPGPGSALGELTLVFGSVEHRALDVAVLVHSLPAMCGGALAECDLGTRSRGDTFVCVARFSRPLAEAVIQRLEFWAWRIGGTAPRVSRQGRAALRACDLVLPRISPASLGATARDLLGHFLVSAPDTMPARPALRLELGGADASGLAFEPRRRAVFVPSPRPPPIGDELSLEFRLPDGEVLGAEGAVTRVRCAGEDGPGTPAGFAVTLFDLDPRLVDALDAFSPGKGDIQRRQAPRYPVSTLARLTGLGEAAPPADNPAYVENLSQGGAFVRTLSEFAKGARVRLELALPGGPAANVTATVVHKNDRGVGIRFDPDPAADASIGAVLEQAATHRRRALVVDDDALCTRMISDELRERGFEVFSAADGTEGVHSLMDLLLDLDLLLVDLHMPGIDGEKLIRLVRNAGGERDLTIAVMTGDSDVAVQERLAAAGANAVLPKSLGMARIADAAVQKQLRREWLRQSVDRRLERPA